MQLISNLFCFFSVSTFVLDYYNIQFVRYKAQPFLISE